MVLPNPRPPIGEAMQVPIWGQYMMLIASAIGTYLLFVELSRRGWPSPLGG